MDIMGPLTSIRVFWEVPASMGMYLLGVQEWLGSLGHLTTNTSILALWPLVQCESHRLVMRSAGSNRMLVRLLKETAGTSVVNTYLLPLYDTMSPKNLCYKPWVNIFHLSTME
jgi:hypothetical protein